MMTSKSAGSTPASRTCCAETPCCCASRPDRAPPTSDIIKKSCIAPTSRSATTIAARTCRPRLLFSSPLVAPTAAPARPAVFAPFKVSTATFLASAGKPSLSSGFASAGSCSLIPGSIDIRGGVEPQQGHTGVDDGRCRVSPSGTASGRSCAGCAERKPGPGLRRYWPRRATTESSGRRARRGDGIDQAGQPSRTGHRPVRGQRPSTPAETAEQGLSPSVGPE